MHSKTIKHRMRKWVDEYKQNVGCELCESKVELEFHHRDPETKFKSIARLISDRTTWLRLWAEMEKCDILCKQCHKDVHREMRNRATY